MYYMMAIAVSAQNYHKINNFFFFLTLLTKINEVLAGEAQFDPKSSDRIGDTCFMHNGSCVNEWVVLRSDDPGPTFKGNPAGEL